MRPVKNAKCHIKNLGAFGHDGPTTPNAVVLAGPVMQMRDSRSGRASARFWLQLDLAGSITPNRPGLQEARKA